LELKALGFRKHFFVPTRAHLVEQSLRYPEYHAYSTVMLANNLIMNFAIAIEIAIA